MSHVIACALTLVWVAANIGLWSLGQSHVALFWQALGMLAVAFPTLGWYVTRAQG